jgi:hypothetical protein
MTCQAKQYSDEMSCTACGLSWNISDPNPPKCRQPLSCAVCDAETGPVRVGKYAVCNDPRCAEVAKVWLDREPSGFTHWESDAVKAGGRAAGAYLVKIGKTGMATLTPDQWKEFCRVMVSEYRIELRRQAALQAPPF